MLTLIIKIILAYLLGSVSGSLFVGKLKKVDIREQGSGNAGGTNAFRTQGLVFALAVVIIDIGKGFLAAWWVPALDFGGAQMVVGPDLLMVTCGFAAVVGHCYPIWHGFRGGKGAGAAVGVLIAVEPWLLIPLLVTWLLTLVLTGYVGLSTVLAGFSLIPAAWWFNNQVLMIFSIVLALFLLFTHRVNIRNLREGTENRFEGIHLFSRKR